MLENKRRINECRKLKNANFGSFSAASRKANDVDCELKREKEKLDVVKLCHFFLPNSTEKAVKICLKICLTSSLFMRDNLCPSCTKNNVPTALNSFQFFFLEIPPKKNCIWQTSKRNFPECFSTFVFRRLECLERFQNGLKLNSNRLDDAIIDSPLINLNSTVLDSEFWSNV